MELESPQIGRQLFHLPLAILVEEEPRVGQSSADDPLVALTHQTFRIVATIDDGQKMRRQ